ncbi:MAG TPA: acyl-CoA dehydrogenase family protein [Burkholderiaceae bacterium]|nr:acyl-CoA dehydrogenase family protein [Burkholderiaceae bacterium]
MSSSEVIPRELDDFLGRHAETLDADGSLAATVVPLLGSSGLLRRGVPAAFGGDGATVNDAVHSIAAVAQRSLAAAFVFWGQRVFIEYLLHSPNTTLRDRWLPGLLAGRTAGATGLSNAMKFLSGIEALQIRATGALPAGDRTDGRVMNGSVPWATNLRREGFVVAVAVAGVGDASPFIAALPSDRVGLSRSDDLDLIALRGTNTASLMLRGLPFDDGDVIADDARNWLPQVRPAFLGLQCGLALGLARAALAAARERGANLRPVLGPAIDSIGRELQDTTAALTAGLADERFVADAPALFRLRIRLAEATQQAVQHELMASGGRAYHRDQPLGFARRWREAAFIPIVTPSLTQLQGELLKRAAAAR